MSVEYNNNKYIGLWRIYFNYCVLKFLQLAEWYQLMRKKEKLDSRAGN
jgi:hypothetical protein